MRCMSRSIPARWRRAGIGFEDVRNALAATTLDRPKGTLEGAHQTYTLDTNDQLFNAAAFNNVIVAYRNGAPVRVKDVGNAIDSVQNARIGAWFFDKPAEGLAIQRQAGRQHHPAGRHDQGDGAAASWNRSRPRSMSIWFPTARWSSAPRCTTCSSR